MKIGNSPELNAYTKVSTTRTGGADAGRATTDAAGTGATRATGVAAEDAASQVELSSAASSLMSSSAASVAGSDDSIDMDKVNRIANAIRNGEFSINAGVIADKLIANTAELLGKVQSH